MEIAAAQQGIAPRYKILEKVGSGGMGIVYKAWDDHLQRFVAIKILTTPSLSEEKLTLRFLREARAASALNHPHICTIHDAEQFGILLYLVMEFLDGNTLGELLRQGKIFSAREVAVTGIAICDALAAAHEKGIIHRDIKPDNIMLARDGSAKVMDFGLAKLTQREDHDTGEIYMPAQVANDSFSALRGTAAYMSPEQIECRPVDERTDIFTLGIVLYEMLTRVYPFDGEDALTRMQSILQDEPRSFTADKNGKAGELQQIILHAMAKNPDNRPPGARALQKDLQRFLQSVNESRIHPARRWLLSLIPPIILILISIALVFIWPQANPQLQPAPDLKIFPVTFSAESEYFPHFSPDDEEIIYFTRNEYTHESRLCLKTLATGARKNLPLYGQEADWSPDGAELVVSGAPGITIADTAGRVLRQISTFGGKARWSPDGSQIAFAGHDKFLLSDAIYLCNLVDGAIHPITPQNSGKFTSPAWSPDGRWLACTAGEGSSWDIWLIEAATSRTRSLVLPGEWITEPVWAPSGDILYYLSNKNGIRDIWRVALDPSRGKLLTAPQQLTAGLNIQEMDIASSGKKIAFTRSENKNQLWQISLTHPATDKLLLMENLNGPENIQVSPDGQSLIVQTYLSGRQCLVRKSLRTMDEQILFSAQPAYAPCWTPDGRWVLFDAGGGDNADIWRIPATGGQAEKLVASPKADWLPTVSPDGRQLCFVSNRTGQFDLWLQEMDGSAVRQLTHTPEMESRAAWANNGKCLAFYASLDKEDKYVIYRYDLAEERIEVLATMHHHNPMALGQLEWKEDDSALYFLPDFVNAVLYEISPDRKEVKPLLSKNEVGLSLRGSGFGLHANTGYFFTGEEIRDFYIAEGL